MQLKGLSITRSEWGDRKGMLSGKVTFEGASGEITLPLDEHLSKQIVDICAEGIVRVSRHVANNLTAEVINAVPAPAPPV